MSKIKDICEIHGRVGRKGYTVEDLTDEGPYVLGANDITTDNQITFSNAKHLTREKYEESPEIFIKKFDILVVKVGSTIGKVGIVNKDIGEASINPNCVIVRAKDINPFYLYYYLCSPQGRAYLINNSSASGQPALNQKDLGNMDIPDVDLSIQQKIVDLLNPINDKIELNNKINSELENMVKELYEYRFVQFDFPDENGKPYKSSGGKMVWNDELKREIPEGWEVKKAKGICPVVTGKEDANFSTPNGEYKFFTCSQDTLRCDTPAFEGKSILIAGNGVFNVKYYNGMFNAYQRTYVLIPDDEKYVGVLYLVSKDLIDSFTKKSAGSIVKFITKGDVEGITLLDPHNDKLLNQINSIIETIAHNIEENDKLSELRDFLLPMLMNGQVIVK